MAVNVIISTETVSVCLVLLDPHVKYHAQMDSMDQIVVKHANVKIQPSVVKMMVTACVILVGWEHIVKMVSL